MLPISTERSQSHRQDIFTVLLLTSLNFFVASSDPLLRSGCHFNACRDAVSVSI